MKKTEHTTEQIIRILREAETSGQSHEELCRQHNISPQTFYCWKSKYGGMGISEVRTALPKLDTPFRYYQSHRE